MKAGLRIRIKGHEREYPLSELEIVGDLGALPLVGEGTGADMSLVFLLLAMGSKGERSPLPPELADALRAQAARGDDDDREPTPCDCGAGPYAAPELHSATCAARRDLTSPA